MGLLRLDSSNEIHIVGYQVLWDDLVDLVEDIDCDEVILNFSHVVDLSEEKRIEISGMLRMLGKASIWRN